VIKDEKFLSYRIRLENFNLIFFACLPVFLSSFFQGDQVNFNWSMPLLGDNRLGYKLYFRKKQFGVAAYSADLAARVPPRGFFLIDILVTGMWHVVP
jgi:hypothetical protein